MREHREEAERITDRLLSNAAQEFDVCSGPNHTTHETLIHPEDAAPEIADFIEATLRLRDNPARAGHVDRCICTGCCDYRAAYNLANSVLARYQETDK